MTSNTRRPGFRLWGGDSADEPEGSATDQPAEQDAMDAASAEGSPVDATAEGPSTEASASEPKPAPASQPEPASPESAGFLASLVGAMRSVAEETRETGLAELRAAVDARVSELERDAMARADEIRRQADADVAGIADWQRSETERIAREAETKTATRRQQLEQQLADSQASSEAQVAATRARLADHERELRAFFSQLSEIKDPASFVAAAERMPRPPRLDSQAPEPAPAPRNTLDRRLAELGVDRQATPAPAPAEPAEPPTAAAAPEPEASTSAPEPEAARQEPEPAPAPDPEPAAEQEASRDAELAQRMKQLDEKLADAPAPAPAPAGDVAEADAASDSSTSVVVKGLGSFGAITSFKQALERVDGIDGVTLSLGPTGEFVYRASHAPGYDLAAAVRSIEGPAAQIEHADGALRVTVNRSR
jgi:hypothetical protein